MATPGAHLRFRPSGVATLLLFFFLPVFTGLGLWQLQRADDKRAQFAQFDDRAGVEEISGLPDGNVPRYAAVRIAGRFVSDQQFLLDNMTHEGRSGYHVLTPFAPTGEGRWLLVNRGWVPAAADRVALPDVAVVGEQRTVTGQLDLLPRPGLDLGAPSEAAPGWPQVVFFPDMSELAAQLERPLFDYQLLLDPDQTGGFVRSWGPRSMAPEKHLGYAVQWFAFAVVLVIIYLVLGLRRGLS